MDAYLSAPSFDRPALIEPSGWLEHAPFAFWLVDALRPRRFVELGTHHGYSYFAVCQAVRAVGLGTRCHAIDTWRGDEHAGSYGDEVFDRVAAHNEREYSAFSELIQSTFDDARARFEDDTIDLLHLDGRHYYEDVSHDFENWRPTLSDRAVVLFHDTMVRDRDFGVHRLWAEVQKDYPSFEFKHGNGLGVLGVGKALPPRIADFFKAVRHPAAGDQVRSVYARLGSNISVEFALDTARRERDELRDQAALAAEREAAYALRDRLASIEQELAAGREKIAALRDRLTASETAAEEAAQAEAVARSQEAAARKQRRTDVATIADLQARIREQTAAIDGLLASTSWRATAPLRFGARAVRWMGRNGRRGAKLMLWLGSGQFARARDASVPYRRRLREIAGRHLPIAAPPETAKGTDHPDPAYAAWIEQNDILTDADRSLIRTHIEALTVRPRFSIVMPVYDTPPAFLRQALDSVLAQLYPDWELCIADDASPTPTVRAILEEYAALDDRIRLSFRQKNGGISACSNTALAMAEGDWVVLMDHDDLLSEHALYLIAEKIEHDPGAAIVYSDEDLIDPEGRRFNPYFKPDWDYDLFLGQNLISHLGAYRADLAHKVGGFREGYEGSQDWDFALRVLDTEADARVLHVPFVLYHWRHFAGTFSQKSLARATDAARRAVTDHLERTGQNASCRTEGHSSHLHIRRELPGTAPTVSVIVPTRDQAALLKTCIDGLLNRTEYVPIEIIVIDNGSNEPEALNYLAEIRTWPTVTVLRDPRPFNFSRLVNQGVAAASGEVVVLFNNDVEVINPDWLHEMVSHVLRPGVGAVGAKLYYPDGNLQHGGVLLGLGGIAGHVHHGASGQSPGYANRLNLTHNLSCVTAACIATRREIYMSMGGFNEFDLPVAFNDVDFCIRLRESGHRVIWTPHAELYHHESVSRGRDVTPEQQARSQREQDYMCQSWADVLDSDPYFNPNLDRFSTNLRPGVNNCARKPWRARPDPDNQGPEPAQKETGKPRSQQFSVAKIVKSDDCDLSRRDKLVLGLDLAEGRGLEIGPSHRPIAPKRDGYNVEILDHADAATLKAKYAPHNVDIDQIEEVDHVWRGEPLDELTGRREWYDWIIASHVIEHTPDFVAFLQQCRRMLRPEGLISLAVPDHRYCFDHFRSVSTPGDILLAHLERRTRHTAGTMWDMISLATKMNDQITWKGSGTGEFRLMRGPEEAKSHFEAMLRSDQYVDLHNWCFTPASFQLAIDDMRRLGHLELAVARVFPTEGHEFFVQLRVAHVNEPDETDRFKLVRQMKLEACQV